MKRLLALMLTAVTLALSPAAPASAQWYAGADAGMAFHAFRADYAYPVGTPDRYVNRASGLEAGVLIGYDFSLDKTIALGGEVRAAANAARWEMDTDDVFSGTDKGGPAHLRYEIPWTIRAAAVLKVKLLPDLALTAEGGLGWGLTRMTKTSAASTAYAFEAWVPGFAAGAGLEWRLTRRLDLIARFAYVGYGKSEITSRFPDGEAWETVTGRHLRLSGRAGVVFRIGDR